MRREQGRARGGSSRKISIVLIHGVSVERPSDWADSWVDALRKRISTDAFEVRKVSWEAIANHEVRRPGRIPDLVGDVSQIWKPEVNRLVLDTVKDAVKSNHRVWIMGHSLGSVLAYRACIDKRFEHYVSPPIERLITFGAPLWRLEWLGLIPVVRMPRSTERWLNIWGVNDWVVAPFWRRWTGMAGLGAASQNFAARTDHNSDHYLKTPAMERALA